MSEVKAQRQYKATQTARLLSCSASKVRKMWASGELGYVRVGDTRYCTDEHIAEYQRLHTHGFYVALPGPGDALLLRKAVPTDDPDFLRVVR